MNPFRNDLGRTRRQGAAGPPDSLKAVAQRWGNLAGKADVVVEAGAQAARERGDFASSLMGCREVQERLAGLIARAELVRFGARRIGLLLERGERDRAAFEAPPLEARAVELAEAARALALPLLGEAWVRIHLDGDGGPPAAERTTHEARNLLPQGRRRRHRP